MEVVVLVLLVLVTGGRQSQLLVLSLSLKFDNNIFVILAVCANPLATSFTTEPTVSRPISIKPETFGVLPY